MLKAATKMAKAISILCWLWMITYPIFGGGRWGKDLFASWAKDSFLHDRKAGVPILMLAVPILIAASVAALFSVTTPKPKLLSGSPSQKGRMENIFDSLLVRSGGDGSTPWAGLVVSIFLPCLFYVISSLRRHLSEADMSTDTAIMESANVFGMVAIIALSWLLIPVTRRGPISRLFAWDPILISKFHIWSGRVVVMGGLIHGSMHMFRFALQGGGVLSSYILPPMDCWKHPQEYQPPICEEADEGDCSCYDHFVPLTGLVALLGLLVIGLSSLYRVRRRSFASFAMLHYIFTPLSVVAICIHYNKAILYASGSVLYYLASNYPTWIELFGHRIRKKPIKVVSVNELEADASQPLRSCISLTIEATESAVRQYRPGVHGRLFVPSMSRVAHPFTINLVPNKARQIRIIFRVTGPFTRSLGAALCQTDAGLAAPLSKTNGEAFEDEARPSQEIPKLFLDGYFGSGMLLDYIARHDVCVIVAAGIGITPYLSLFAELVTKSDSNHSDGLMTAVHEGAVLSPKTIVVHWVCRDESLINYCQEEYFDPCLQANTNASTTDDSVASVKIVVHRTGGGHSTFSDLEATAITTGEVVLARNSTARLMIDPSTESVPFDISSFQVGQGLVRYIGCFSVFSILSWGGLWFLWAWYQRQSGSSMIERLYTVVVVLGYGFVVALIANLVFHLDSVRRRRGWTPIAGNEAERLENGKDTGMFEMTPYMDPTDDLSPAQPQMETDLDRRKVMTSIMSQGRPRIADVIQDLTEGVRPALFCCVPRTLEKELRGAIRPASTFGASIVSFYPESFEV